LFFRIDIDYTTAFSEVFGDGVEDSGIVTDMVGRIGTGPHYARYSDFGHYDCFIYYEIKKR
jgi:hypothetical protein